MLVVVVGAQHPLCSEQCATAFEDCLSISRHSFNTCILYLGLEAGQRPHSLLSGGAWRRTCSPGCKFTAAMSTLASVELSRASTEDVTFEVAGCHDCAQHQAISVWRSSKLTVDAAADGPLARAFINQSSAARRGGKSGRRATHFALPSNDNQRICKFTQHDIKHNPVCNRSATVDPNVERTLTAQFIRSIDARITYAARWRPVPHAAGRNVSAEQLQLEFEETRNFLKKTLKKDPKLKPEDIVVDLTHLGACTSCANYERSHLSQHCTSVLNGRDGRGLSWDCKSAPVRRFGMGQQLLLDDWPIESWRNVVRFLNPPRQKRITKFPPNPPTPFEPTDMLPVGATPYRRFGCPCSATTTAAGGVKLWHATGEPVVNQVGKIMQDEHQIVVSESADGLGRWTDETPISIEGSSIVKSFTASRVGSASNFKRMYRQNALAALRASMASSIPEGFDAPEMDVADVGIADMMISGYEGIGGVACLATSVDGGVTWSTLASPEGDRFHFSGRNYPVDNHGNILTGAILVNSTNHTHMKGYRAADCKPIPHYSGAKSYLGRAADTYVVPVSLSPDAFRETRHQPTIFHGELDAMNLRDGGMPMSTRRWLAFRNAKRLENRSNEFIIYRHDFAAGGGWREIRGAKIAGLRSEMADVALGRWATTKEWEYTWSAHVEMHALRWCSYQPPGPCIVHACNVHCCMLPHILTHFA